MSVPTTAQALSTLARLTLTRVTRGKLLWISLAIAFLPIMYAGAMGQAKGTVDILSSTLVIETFVLAILPPLYGAPAVAEEIEERTATYLWSRPIKRWVIVAGKLLALAPFAGVVVLGSWVLAIVISLHHLPSTLSMVGLGFGAAGITIVSCGIATLFPKRGMALAIIYVLVIDLPLGEVPASVRWLSVKHAAKTLADLDSDTAPAYGAIALVVISAIWLMVAFRRVGRLET
ncbi:hypothetical protein BH11MYX1_BH11MYX1_17020 [soil metagenome]